MKHALRRSTTFMQVSIMLGVVLCLALVFFLTRPVDASNESGRLVTIHDRGQEKVLLTNAATIGDALKDAGISLDARDAVEPAVDEEMVASEYSVNIFRARPVIVVDGASREKIITPYQSPRKIAEDIGIELRLEDRLELTRSDDIIADGASLRLVVDRASPVELDLYGSKYEVYTQGETVRDFLSEKAIELERGDRVRPSLDTPLSAGMGVRVWREGKQTVTVEEKVRFGTQQIQDADQKIGYKKVQKKGKHGKSNVTYEIEIKNGVEVSRKKIATIVTVRPVKQVEIVGIKAEVLSNYSADKAAIMTSAGIAKSDQGFAAYIIDHENAAWCPIRWQGTPSCWASYSEKFPGAEGSDQVGYGLCQSTPGNKMASAGADWRTNPVTQMKWCHGYALGRYGSWEAAYRFKVANGWW